MQGRKTDTAEGTGVFTEEEKALLDALNDRVPLSKFLSNKSYIDKMGLDFIHVSAKMDGNAYDRIDTLTLLDYGLTAGGKRFGDARMILGIRDAFDLLIREDPPADDGTLREMHRLLSRGRVPAAPGERTDGELGRIFERYSAMENAFDRAAYLHCSLARLKYFGCCDGSVARMMLNVSLKRDGRMLYIPKEERVPEYLAAVARYRETGKYDGFRAYFIAEYKDAVGAILAVEEAKRREIKRPPR